MSLCPSFFLFLRFFFFQTVIFGFFFLTAVHNFPTVFKGKTLQCMLTFKKKLVSPYSSKEMGNPGEFFLAGSKKKFSSVFYLKKCLFFWHFLKKEKEIFDLELILSQKTSKICFVKKKWMNEMKWKAKFWWLFNATFTRNSFISSILHNASNEKIVLWIYNFQNLCVWRLDDDFEKWERERRVVREKGKRRRRGKKGFMWGILSNNRCGFSYRKYWLKFEIWIALMRKEGVC